MAAKRELGKEDAEAKAKKKKPRAHIEPEYEGVKKTRPPPPRWEETWHKLAQMRGERTAPVDEMGAACLADKDTPELHSYQTLIGLMLSSQTRDAMTERAVGVLKKHGLTIENIRKTPEEDIAQMIKCVSFYRRKAIYIKKTTEMLATKYKGVPPNTLKETLEFPGVGPKMAHLYMQIAHGVCTGIGVDTHVHRISNRLRWVKSETPEETRKQLEEWLPFDKWTIINKLMVGFGQTTCRPIGPRCDECLLSNGLCPAARQLLPSARARTAKQKREEAAGDEDQEEAEEEEEEDSEAAATTVPAAAAVSVKVEEPAVAIKQEDQEEEQGGHEAKPTVAVEAPARSRHHRGRSSS